MTAALRHRLGLLLSLGLFSLALWALHRELAHHGYRDVMRELAAIPPTRLALALGLTAVSYLALSAYDALGLRFLDLSLAWPQVVLGAFTGYSFSNSVGHSLLVGTPVRYRIYSEWGLSAVDVTRLVAFCTLTFWLGFLATGGAALVLEPFALPDALRLHVPSARALGALFLAVPALYLVACATVRRTFRIRGWEVQLPSLPFALGQIAVASIDWILAASVLYVLFLPTLTMSFPAFLAHFLIAQIAGLASQVPGGLGIFESVLVLQLAPAIPASTVIGVLLAFRAIYYLLPLLLSAGLLVTHELLRREGVRRVGRRIGGWLTTLIPTLLAVLLLAAGSVLLFSGATPAVPQRMAWLRELMPLPVVELSHLLGSLAGAALLLLARGAQRRLDGAFHLSVVMLAVGVVASLGKGLDWEEALLLAVLLAALIPSRRHFYRHAALTAERFTPGWVAAVALVLLASTWLGFFAHKHVEYAHDLWWQFAFHADAPRFLRATVVALGAVVIFALARLLRPAPPEPEPPTGLDLERARPVVAAAPESTAHLALVGDKRLLFSESGRGLLMYATESRSWIAMGDPLGPEPDRVELAWRFRELADLHDGWTVFYQASPESLPLYLDLGLSLLKIGEEARVELARFGLEGTSRKAFRNTLNKLEKEGIELAIVPPGEVAPLLPEVRAISDAWLAAKATREKGFSLGFFDEAYLCRLPLALLRLHGRAVAFANLWVGGEHEEVSLDLMRHVPEAPNGIMDYVFLRLLLWGQAEGYRFFNLGMAPLSGFESRRLAPLWSRLGGLAFRHGEHFYNFQGLRHYKAKFDPIWEPRYLASPGGLALPRILTHLATLIGRGLKGVVAK